MLLECQMAGPAQGFLKDGKFTCKQKELAEIQANYYEHKIRKIKKLIPQVNFDPLEVLKQAYNRWIPEGGKPEFKLKKCHHFIAHVINLSPGTS